MILRNETQGNYVVVSQAIMHDRSLKLFDRGLLVTLISLPNNWHFTVDGLANILSDGRDAIKTGLKRLEVKGYLTIEQLRENGHFSGNCLRINVNPDQLLPKESEIREEKPEAPESGKTSAEEEPLPDMPAAESPSTESPLAEIPLAVNPSPGKPSAGIPTQYKNNKSNNHRSNIQGSNNKICHISAGKEAANGTVRRKQDHSHGASGGKWTQDEIDLYGL